ncbi:MAG: right-handed parallel beta-helix repeat-containing protein [Pseudomonadota bacterium]
MKNRMFIGLVALLSACGGDAGDPSAPLPATQLALAAVTSIDEGDPSLMAPPEDDALADPGEETGNGFVSDSDYVLAGYTAEGTTGDAPALAQAGKAPVRLYVSPNGSDNNAGSADKPFRSIARAIRAVTAGTTVYVAPGTYAGGFRNGTSGSAKARIAFISTRKWGARIVPPKNSPNKTAWDNRGSYVDIIGFEVDGSAHAGGTRWTYGIYNGGSHDSIRNNHVHHIAQGNVCNRGGGAAIGIDSYYGGEQSDVIANLVHDIGPAGCRYVQGIYVSTSGRIKNNVIYRVAEGGIHLWHDARDVIITNNTVTGSNTGIIVGGGNYYRTSGPNDRTAVYSNIVYDNRMGISEQGRTGKNNTYRNNLVFQNASYNWQLKNGLRHEDTVASAPQFVAHARSGPLDLRLSSGSPAIGRGTAAHAEDTDFAGRPRNGSAGYDIGAYQH